MDLLAFFFLPGSFGPEGTSSSGSRVSFCIFCMWFFFIFFILGLCLCIRIYV